MRISFLLAVVLFPLLVFSQIKKAPEVKEGDGPWNQLIIRGVTLINGTGAPPIGPVDIVVEKNRIKQISVARSWISITLVACEVCAGICCPVGQSL